MEADVERLERKEKCQQRWGKKGQILDKHMCNMQMNRCIKDSTTGSGSIIFVVSWHCIKSG